MCTLLPLIALSLSVCFFSVSVSVSLSLSHLSPSLSLSKEGNVAMSGHDMYTLLPLIASRIGSSKLSLSPFCVKLVSKKQQQMLINFFKSRIS